MNKNMITDIKINKGRRKIIEINAKNLLKKKFKFTLQNNYFFLNKLKKMKYSTQ